METKDFIIYNGMITAARRVFDNVKCPAGEYSAKDLANNMLSKYFFEDEFYNNYYNELITIEFDGYKCKFPAGAAFDICAQIETAWNIPSARRAKFVRAAEDAAPAVCFNVPAVAKTIINAVVPAKEKNANESIKNVCIDTARRAVVAVNGKVLTAVAVPEMYVNKAANFSVSLHPNSAGRFCLDPSLFKTGNGKVTIKENGAAVNGAKSCQIFTDYNFPNWENVLPAVSEDAALIIGKQFAEIKKTILAAVKYTNTFANIVILRAVAGVPELQIISYKENAKDNKIADQEKTQKIKLSQPAPVSFTIGINGKNLNTVAAAEKMYVISEKQPVIFTAANYFALLMPVQLEKTPYHEFTFNVPGNKSILNICDFPALNDENSPAAVASVEDAQGTAAPAAADNWENSLPRAVVCFWDTAQDAPETAPAVAADSLPAADIPAVEDAQETAVNVQDETAAPVAAAEDETRPAFEDAAAAVADSMPEYFDNLAAEDQETARAAFAAAAANIYGVSVEDAQETAVNVQDETAAPVAVSLPVPVSAVNIWYAVYNSENVLHGVYFSQLLADELVIKSLFAAGHTWQTVPVADPNSAPAVLPAVDIPAVEDAQETAVNVQDETAAPAAADKLETLPFASAFAILPEIWETAAPVQKTAKDAPETAPAAAADSLPAADILAAEDAQETETAVNVPALLIAANFARRFRSVFNVAAALLCLLLIGAAPRFMIEKQPAPVAVPVPAAVAADSLAVPAADIPAVEDAPETAVNVQDETAAPAADSLPANMIKRAQTARKRARAAADPVPAVASVAVADSLPSLPAADSLKTCPAFNVPVPVAADSLAAEDETAAPVQETAQDAPETAPAVVADSLPAADSLAAEDAQETETAAPADPVPATNGAPANSPAPAVPVAVPGCPAVPAAVMLVFLML